MRDPKPYYYTSHRAWYINLGGQKVRLTPPCDTQEGKEAALKEYHALMAGRQPAAKGTVAGLLDLYLEHCHQNLAESTYGARRRTLESYIALRR
jgi:hypothetical protein